LLSISHLELEGRFISDEPLFKTPFMLGITICVSFEISTVEVQSILYTNKYFSNCSKCKSSAAVSLVLNCMGVWLVSSFKSSRKGRQGIY
jgi:hypothetical protein